MWIVTSGTYADYGIEGAFNREEDAQRFAELLDRDVWADSVRVKQLKVNPVHIDALQEAEDDRYAFRVWIDGGEVMEADPVAIARDPGEIKWSQRRHGIGDVEVYARDRDDAIRQAIELVDMHNVRTGSVV